MYVRMLLTAQNSVHPEIPISTLFVPQPYRWRQCLGQPALLLCHYHHRGRCLHLKMSELYVLFFFITEHCIDALLVRINPCKHAHIPANKYAHMDCKLLLSSMNRIARKLLWSGFVQESTFVDLCACTVFSPSQCNLWSQWFIQEYISARYTFCMKYHFLS